MRLKLQSTLIDFPLPEGWELHFYPLVHWSDAEQEWVSDEERGDFILRNTQTNYDIVLQPTPHDEGLQDQIRSYCGLA